MIRPPCGCCARITRNASRVHRNAPVRFTATTAFQSPGRARRGRPAGAAVPALLNSRSTRPCRRTVVSNSAAHAGLVGDVGRHRVRAGRARPRPPPAPPAGGRPARRSTRPPASASADARRRSRCRLRSPRRRAAVRWSWVLPIVRPTPRSCAVGETGLTPARPVGLLGGHEDRRTRHRTGGAGARHPTGRARPRRDDGVPGRGQRDRGGAGRASTARPPGDFRQAAAGAELVVNATAGSHSTEAVGQADPGPGTVLLDVSNALDGNFPPGLTVPPGDSTAERLQRAHPRHVRGQGAEHDELRRDGAPGAGAGRARRVRRRRRRRGEGGGDRAAAAVRLAGGGDPGRRRRWRRRAAWRPACCSG